MDKIEKVKGWVARDDDGTLAIHYEKPRRVCYHKNDIFSDGTPWAWENEAGYGLLPVKTFPDLKWEDEPLEVELTIKRVSTLTEEPDKGLEEAAEIIAKNILGRDYLAELDEDCAIDALEDAKNLVKAGAEWQRRQMIKGAVEGYISATNEVSAVLALPKGDFKKGDKVRIIVCKKEE